MEGEPGICLLGRRPRIDLYYVQRRDRLTDPTPSSRFAHGHGTPTMPSYVGNAHGGTAGASLRLRQASFNFQWVRRVPTASKRSAGFDGGPVDRIGLRHPTSIPPKKRSGVRQAFRNKAPLYGRLVGWASVNMLGNLVRQCGIALPCAPVPETRPAAHDVPSQFWPVSLAWPGPAVSHVEEDRGHVCGNSPAKPVSELQV
jgi:hypothetical protein